MSKVGSISIIIKVSKDSILSSKGLADLRELVRRTKEVDSKGKSCSEVNKPPLKAGGIT